MWFILGIIVGVFADRIFPEPVSMVINWVKSVWEKVTTSSTPPPPPPRPPPPPPL